MEPACSQPGSVTKLQKKLIMVGYATFPSKLVVQYSIPIHDYLDWISLLRVIAQHIVTGTSLEHHVHQQRELVFTHSVILLFQAI